MAPRIVVATTKADQAKAPDAQGRGLASKASGPRQDGVRRIAERQS